jgi:hypothetical protein
MAGERNNDRRVAGIKEFAAIFLKQHSCNYR